MSASSATLEPAARAELRSATRIAHDRVDAAFAAFDLSSPAGYARFLQAHAEAFLPIEEGLDRFGVERLLPDWPGRRRGDALRADLADLRLVPRPVDALAIAGDSHAWGMLYVLEGSRFGGRILADALAAGQPRRYIGAVHRPGGWGALVKSMNVALSRPEALGEAVTAANEAFERFERAARQNSGLR